ncbi:hypothetical protein AKJ16_DCAP18574 [Drosera capensis]
MLRRWRNAGAALIAASKPYRTIQAIPREATGPRVAARERAQGRIPEVVFAQPQLQINRSGKNDAVTRSVRVIMKELVEPEVFCSTVFKLQVRAGAGSKVLLDSSNVVPIKARGWIVKMCLIRVDSFDLGDSLKFLCPAERIPPVIEVDIRNLDIGDKLLLHDIKFDPYLKLLSKNEKKSVCRRSYKS